MKELLLLIALLAGAIAPPSAGVAAPAAAPEVSLSPQTSANWAGYAAEGGTFTAVGATWTVPRAASEESAATNVAWVGVGGVSTRDLIQAGTQSFVEDGVEGYRAWYELLPDYQQVLPLKVSAGDSVTVSLTELSSGLWYLLFENGTTGESVVRLLAYDSSLTSAEWVVERPLIGTRGGAFGYIPLDEFGEVEFTDAYAVRDGIRVSLSEAGAEPITMMSRTGELLATPSMTRAQGSSFSVTRSSGGLALPEPNYLFILGDDGAINAYSY